MKTLIILSFSILLFACSSNAPESEPALSDSTETHTEEIIDIHQANEPVERAFEFSEMPTKWWLLTKEGDEFIRYNHWDAQDEIIEFAPGEDGTGWLDISYAHDSDMGEITNFKAILIEGENSSQVNGSFTFYSHLEDESTDINFYWNQMEHYIEFENLSSERLYYVSKESLGYFLYEETFREPD